MAVDSAELAKFDRLAHRWWDIDGEFRTLHDINSVRVRYIADRAQVRGRRIVEVGCGGGILTESLAYLGGKVTGIDPARGPITIAKLHAIDAGIEHRISYHNTTAEEYYAENSEQFDVVTALEILEHVPDYGQSIQALADMCRPGGDVFISTINRTPAAFCLAIVGAEYVLRLLPRGTHEYRKFLKPSEIASVMRAANLIVKEVKGYSYNPFTRFVSLCDNVDVNYLMHAQKPE